MKVKIIDAEHELDLEDSINDFVKDKEIIDIKYQLHSVLNQDQEIEYSYSALIMYKFENKNIK